MLQDATDDKKVIEIRSKMIRVMEDISSLTNFVSGKESMTDMPVGSREMLSKIFVKASKDIGDFNPMKSPEEIRAIEKRLNAVYENLKSKQGRDLASDINKSLKEKMFSDPSIDPKLKEEYLGAMEKYGNIKDVLDEKKLADSFGIGETGDMASKQKSLANTVKQFSNEKNVEGSFARQFINNLKGVAPEVGKELEGKIAKASEDLKLTSSMYAESPFAEYGLGGLIPSGKAALTRTASIAGTGIGKVDKAITGVQKLATNIPRKIFDSIGKDNGENLARMAEKIRNLNDASSVDLFNKLTKLTTMPPERQKAVVFTLMQQPQYRKMFDAITPDIDENGE
jgi:hypothetical protein